MRGERKDEISDWLFYFYGDLPALPFAIDRSIAIDLLGTPVLNGLLHVVNK